MQNRLLAIPEERIPALRQFLDPVADQVEVPDYIASDPIAFMHRYDDAEDRNLAGFLAALMAWGRRDIVMAKVGNLLERFGTGPADFIGNLTPADEDRLDGFRHRTFTADDIRWLLRALCRIMQDYGRFEDFWTECYREAAVNPEITTSTDHGRASPDNGKSVSSYEGKPLPHYSKTTSSEPAAILSVFHQRFFDLIPESPIRVRKHLSTPKKNSSCKRLWLYLRWTIRKGSCVDPGTMSFMPASELMIPLDVHVARFSRLFGLLSRTANDCKSVTELTRRLRVMDPSDPARYDYALFGLGIRDIAIPDQFIVNTNYK
ncbi:MAG: TIGR02757 family protein [Bacteroidota bacterium]